MQKRKITKKTETVITEILEDGAVENSESPQKKIPLKKIGIPQEPPFVKLYLDTVMYVSDLQERHTSVLTAILHFAPFADEEHQFIILNRGIKLRIAEIIGKTENYVSHTIMELARGRILLHDDRSPRSSSYQINPHIIARGDWKSIEKLRLHIDFSADGKTFWSEIKTAKRIGEGKRYADKKRAEFLARQGAEDTQSENSGGGK